MGKFKRLIVSGCSHTVGEWLPGWRDWWDNSGEKPQFHRILSEYNWSNQLAAKLGITEVYNLASGGNSNHEIMCGILGFDFKPDDLCVICWSYAGREFLYQEAGGIARTMDLLSQFNDTKFYEVHSLFDLETKSREYVHQTILHLEKMNVQYRMAKIEDWNTKSDFWPFYDDHAFMKFDMIDYAADNSHPGVESNKALAEKIYDSLK